MKIKHEFKIYGKVIVVNNEKLDSEALAEKEQEIGLSIENLVNEKLNLRLHLSFEDMF